MWRAFPLLIGFALLATGCSAKPAAHHPPAQGPPAQVDKAEAVRLILAWLSGDGRIPGFDQDYPDAKWMKGERPTFLACDFLAADAHVTDKPKFHRISQAELDKTFREQGLEAAYERGSYLRIKLADESDGKFTLVVENMLNARAGHQYRFVFRQDGAGLRATGKLELVW
jgi:hypothetical protein